MTYEEAIKKRETVRAMLEAREDEYRTLYATVLSKAKTEFDLREAKVQRAIIDMRVDSHKAELRLLNEIIEYRKPPEEPVEELTENTVE